MGRLFMPPVLPTEFIGSLLVERPGKPSTISIFQKIKTKGRYNIWKDCAKILEKLRTHGGDKNPYLMVRKRGENGVLESQRAKAE
jgi:hypothetical protein